MRREIAVRGAIVAALVALVAGAAALAVEAADPAPPGRVALLAGLVVFGALAGYIGLLAASSAVAAVSSAANRLAEGHLGQRVDATTASVGNLPANFNSMAGRVQQLFGNLEAEHARLEAVFDASTDAMLALSRDTTVRFLNPAAAGMLHTTRDAAMNRPFIESARDYELDALVRRAIAKSGTGETSVITFGPRRTSLRAVAVPIREGGDWAVLLILNDLTEVQRVDQVRRDFLGNVSHELRTPLAAIRALVETLEAGSVDSPEETGEFLGRIGQQVDRLTVLVNELLDLSRIESGAIELRPEAVDLSEVVREACSLLATRADEKRVRINCPAPPGVAVEGDRPSLLRIASNLLDNGIKYTQKGSTIHVEIREEGELVALSVRDEGTGISDQDLPRVFERFYKGDASRATAGVGLGLAIVKHLVRAHGGTVEAASPPESGATFTVRLPRTFVGSRTPAAR